MKRPELWSLLVFVIGLTIGTTGTIIAIVFGVEKSKPCDCNGASAELFSVRTGIQKSFMPWSDQFSNTSSPQYEAAVLSISQELTSALLTNGKRLSNLAAPSWGTMASVQVAQLRKGCNNTVVCFAYGVVYQGGAGASLPTLSDIQGQLDSDTNVVDEAFVDDVSNPDANQCLYYEPTSISPTSRGTTPRNMLPTITTGELSSSSTYSTAWPEDNSTQISTTSHAVTSPGTTSTAKGPDHTISQHLTSPSFHTASSSRPVPTTWSASTLASSAMPSTYLPTTAGTTTASSISSEPSPSSFTSNFQTTRTSVTSSPISSTTAATTSVSTLPSALSTSNWQTTTRPVAPSSASSAITASSMPTMSPTASATSSQTTTKSVISSSTSVIITTASPIPSTITASSMPTPSPTISATSSQTTTKSVPSTQSSSISSTTISRTISTPGASSPSSPKPAESKSSTSTPRRSSSATMTPTAYLSASTTAASNTVLHTSARPSSSSVPDQGSSASLPSRTSAQQAPTSSTPLSESTSAQLLSSTSPPPSQSLTSTSRWTTTASCTGEEKYSGDIAVAFELTTNTDTAAVEAFVTTLLTYGNNSFSFSPDAATGVAPSSYILAPYPNTDFYRPTNKYGVLRASDINATLSAFNTFLSFQPESNAMINERHRIYLNVELNAPFFYEDNTELVLALAFDFILGVANHSSTRIVVLVGVSDAFVKVAETSCKKLTDIGYSIFTVSLGSADFSPLATNKSHVYQQGDPTSSVEATKIANEIGTALLSESSICFHSSLPTTPVATTSLLSTSRTITTSRAPSCVDTFIQQDIAFVVELSTSSGSLDASRTLRFHSGSTGPDALRLHVVFGGQLDPPQGLIRPRKEPSRKEIKLAERMASILRDFEAHQLDEDEQLEVEEEQEEDWDPHDERIDVERHASSGHMRSIT